MLKELFAFLFITSIIAIVIAVSIPPLILEPVSWMLNSDIELHKYGHAGLNNQSASYFDFYLASEGETYTKLSILYLGILSSLIFTPVIMCLMTVVSLHLKAKAKIKELRQSYLSSFFEAFSEGKIKPSFWVIFIPLVALIFYIKTQYYHEVISLTNYNLEFFDAKKIYKPATLTTYNGKTVLWEIILEESHPISFTKNDGNFSRINSYIVNITASDKNEEILFSYNTKSQSSSPIQFIDQYIVIFTNHSISVIDSNTLQEIESTYMDQAKIVNPRFSDIYKIYYTPKTRKITLIDIYENKVSLSFIKTLNLASQSTSTIKDKSVISMNTQNNHTPNNSDRPKQYIQPQTIIKNGDFVLLTHKSSIAKKSKDTVVLLDLDMNEQWSYSLSSYNPYLKPFKNRDCEALYFSHSDRYIEISYQFIGMTCATEFVDIKTGSLVARYKTGELDYF